MAEDNSMLHAVSEFPPSKNKHAQESAGSAGIHPGCGNCRDASYVRVAADLNQSSYSVWSAFKWSFYYVTFIFAVVLLGLLVFRNRVCGYVGEALKNSNPPFRTAIFDFGEEL
uniref:Uncharacterized protein n=1 Tax=Ditylenchus dipsaci TaxID=166011 RepID=A0A915CVD0_9BILA